MIYVLASLQVKPIVAVQMVAQSFGSFYCGKQSHHNHLSTNREHAMNDTPPDHAPGPNGFMGCFYRATWATIKEDVLNAFHALSWTLDARSFNLLRASIII